MSDPAPKRSYTRPPGAKAASSKSAAPARTDWGPLARFGMIMLWAASLAGAGFGLKQADEIAARQVTSATRLEWVDKPTWLETDDWRFVLEELENIPGLHPDTDIFDPNVCAYVGETLLQSPWIERIERVSKSHAGAIRVYAVFRRPFSLVEAGTSAYMIDENGVRLPWQTAAAAIDHEKWITIRGVREPAPQIGRRWEGADLADGIKLLKWLIVRIDPLNPPAVRKLISSVSVRNHDRKKSRWSGMLQLLTINPRVYVDWGVPPLEEYPIEAAADLKLVHLLDPRALRYLSEGTSIDLRGAELAPVPTRPEYPTD